MEMANNEIQTAAYEACNYNGDEWIDGSELPDILIDPSTEVDAAVAGVFDDFWLPSSPHQTKHTVVRSSNAETQSRGEPNAAMVCPEQSHYFTADQDEDKRQAELSTGLSGAVSFCMEGMNLSGRAEHRLFDPFDDEIPYPTPIPSLYPNGWHQAFHMSRTSHASRDMWSHTEDMTAWIVQQSQPVLLGPSEVRHECIMFESTAATAVPASQAPVSGMTLSSGAGQQPHDMPYNHRQSKNTSVAPGLKVPPVMTRSSGLGGSSKMEAKPPARKRKADSDPSPSSPVKALTPYNFFFRFERERLLKFISESDGADVLDHSMPSEYLEHYRLTLANSSEFQRKLLEDQWSRDPTVKRKHSKSHGQITFCGLSRRIAQSWKALPPTVKDVFREISLKDFQRYRRETTERY